MGVIRNTIGDFKWTPPDWAVRFGLRKLFSALLLIIAIAILASIAWRYYQSLPTPPQVVASAVPPGLSPVVRNEPKPQPVFVNFIVETDPRLPVEGSSAIARVDLIGSTLDDGIYLEPALPGKWEWISDTQLRFLPQEDWPANQTYKVTYTPEIFAPALRFETLSTSFNTPPFSAEISEAKFYQDPVKTQERKVVATFEFSHPVELDALKTSVELSMRADGQTINDTPVDLEFEMTAGPANRTVYLHSEILDVPQHESFATLTLDKDIKVTSSAAQLDDDIVQSVRIPDVSSYFNVERSQFLLARDENNEPQQTFTLSFTDRVKTESLRKKISLYRLPQAVMVDGKLTRKSYWESPREVTPDILSQSETVDFFLNPKDTASDSQHSLRLDTEVGRYYYLRIENGLESDGKFVLNIPYDTVFQTMPYPKEVSIAQDGAVLPLTGSHKVHFVSRGVNALKIEIGRLLQSDINHLATQMDGDIKDARFNNYRFNQDNLSERDERFITLASSHPKKASFAHLDLSDYLSEGGYFFLRVSGWDAQRKYETGGSDQRIVLITDLGFLAKTGADGSQDLFVHSLATGSPVANANVMLLGKNGLPILDAITNADGHASMPPAREFKREKTPTVYVIRNGRDSVFMPYGRYTRQIDYSRFDTSGEYSNIDGNTLRAQVFTERDLFRPGDTVHIGTIVKRGNWQALDRLPLNLTVRDSRGQLVLDKRIRLPADGFIEQAFETEPTSSTGNYEIALYTISTNNRRRYLGGHSFKVEEFQPDRLRISSQVSGQKTKGWIKPNDLNVTVQLDNLFGTPASDRRVEGSLTLRAAQLYFADYAGYTFTDPLRNDNTPSQSIQRNLASTTTDENGSASLELGIDQYNEGIYELTVYTEGFEAGGGRSVKSRARTILSPLDHLVGFKASGNLQFIRKEAIRTIDFIAVDSDGNQVSLNNLNLTLFERRYVSSLVKQSNGTFAYQSISKDHKISEQPFSIAKTKESYTLPTDQSGRFVAQISNSRGTILSRVPFVVAGARNLAGNLEQNAELDIVLDKESYAPGESIELQITAPYTGTGLITVERDSVLAYQWFTSTTTSSTQSIRVPEELEGNAYVNVTFMRSLDSKEVYMSPLSYALEPFSIKRDARTISLDVNVPKIVEPGSALEIEYQTDKPARLLLFAVDQGILQVANYQRPKPLDFFLTKRALRVTTYQLADLVLPEYVANSISAAPGGGEAASNLGKNLNPFRRSTEAPVVFWSGILDAGPTPKTAIYNVPDYFNGELTIMAVAVNGDAVGDDATKTLVKGPFVLMPNAPVSVAPGDEFDVSVGVANNIENSGPNASVRLTIEPSEHLAVVGDKSLELTVGEGRESSAVFRVRAQNVAGSASLQLSASNGSVSSDLTTTLSVRPATSYTTSLQSAVHGQSPVKLAFERNLRSELAVNSVAASSSPIVLADGLQQYLDHFPHACAEQIVSKVFPQLGLYRQDPDIDDGKIRQQFNALIAKLRARQLSNGGFRFWQSSSEAADFPSVYITHFLTEASSVDLPVPKSMRENAVRYMRELAARESTSADEARLRSYAIYVLTRNGVVTSNYLTSLHEYLDRTDFEWSEDITSAYMAASYRLVKLDELADKLISRYVLSGGNEMYSDFDTRLGRDAQYMFLVAKHFPEQLNRVSADQMQTLVKPIMQNRFNTLSAAFTVLALQAYAISTDSDGVQSHVSLSDESDNEIVAATRIARATLDHLAQSIIAKGGNGILFTNLTQSGYDQSVPESAIAEGIEIDRKYLNANGEAVNKAQLGDELTVRLRLRSTGRPRTNVAVIDLLPGGFEVIANTLSKPGNPWSADYSDIREDRVVTYGTFNDTLTEITYKVKVTAAGTFAVPSASARSMYDPTIRAHTAGDDFVVSRPAQ